MWKPKVSAPGKSTRNRSPLRSIIKCVAWIFIARCQWLRPLWLTTPSNELYVTLGRFGNWNGSSRTLYWWYKKHKKPNIESWTGYLPPLQHEQLWVSSSHWTRWPRFWRAILSGALLRRYGHLVGPSMIKAILHVMMWQSRRLLMEMCARLGGEALFAAKTVGWRGRSRVRSFHVPICHVDDCSFLKFSNYTKLISRTLDIWE